MSIETLTKKQKSEYTILESEDSKLLVPLNRLSYGPEVARVEQRLRLGLRNNDQGYIGNINFEQAQTIVNALNGIVTTPDIFAEFLRTLKLGSRREIKVYDGNRRRISVSRLEQAFKDITKQEVHWRGEHLNHKYKLRVGTNSPHQLIVGYSKFDSSGNLILIEEPLDVDTLMQDRGISLDCWLRREYRTPQGLPIEDIPGGDLYYFYPRPNSVARFNADAGGAYLDCYCDPDDSGPALGVRHTKIFP